MIFYEKNMYRNILPSYNKVKYYKEPRQFRTVNVCAATKKLPKRKSNVEINDPSKKISLGSITGIDRSLNSIEKASQTTNEYFTDETPEYFFLLESIADNLEITRT